MRLELVRERTQVSGTLSLFASSVESITSFSFMRITILFSNERREWESENG